MNYSRNPNENSSQQTKEAIEATHFERGYVVSTPSDSSNVHGVIVKPYGKESNEPCEVNPTAKGDVHIPTVDTDVLIGYRKGDIPFVADVRYNTDDSPPSLKAGERRIGHDLTNANVTFDENGVVTVEADDGTTIAVDGSTVQIDGGTTPIVTDVTTTTDADGHVTDVNVVTDDSILL